MKTTTKELGHSHAILDQNPTEAQEQDNLLKYNEVNCVDKKWCGTPSE